MVETRNLGDTQGTVYGGQVFCPLYTPSAPGWADSSQNFVNKVVRGPKVIIEPSHAGGWSYLYCDGQVKWLKPESTLGRNPATGARNTNLARPVDRLGRRRLAPRRTDPPPTGRGARWMRRAPCGGIVLVCAGRRPFACPESGPRTRRPASANDPRGD